MPTSADARSRVLWIAGVGWDDTPGTDRRMVSALSRTRPVLWVDSPRRRDWGGWLRHGGAAVEPVSPGIERARVPALPGASRWPVRPFTRALHGVSTARLGSAAAGAVVVANPVHGFPARGGARRVLFATDDWVAGASLMGLSESWVRARVTRAVAQADAVVAVTPVLLDSLLALGPSAARITAVIPNGAPAVARLPHIRREQMAGVVGQLNERLNLDVLEAVADRGVTVRLIGPRVASSVSFTRRLDDLISRENVVWTGRLAGPALTAELARLRVGLTPYTDTAFNRASFPLKTLEYLAAGIPVVSTELSASRWLASEHVRVADTPAAFAAAVVAALEETRSEADELARRAFAAAHDWERRAEEFSRVLDGVG